VSVAYGDVNDFLRGVGNVLYMGCLWCNQPSQVWGVFGHRTGSSWRLLNLLGKDGGLIIDHQSLPQYRGMQASGCLLEVDVFWAAT